MKTTLNTRRSTLNFCLTLCILLLATLATARAATNHVTNLNDSGPGSLRQAIAEAAPGDTIDFAVSGTIALTSGELVIDKNLTISGPGATNLTVSGNNSSRIFRITNGIANVVDLTIANGRTLQTGAGILNESILTLRNCFLSNCNTPGPVLTHVGGGIHNLRTLTIMDSTIVSNKAGLGGGVFNASGLAVSTIINSTISRNSDGFTAGGGGIWNEGIMYVTNSTVSENYIGGSGGGIRNRGTLTIASSTICNNGYVSSAGGGIFNEGECVIKDSIVAHNIGPIAPDWVGELSSRDYNLIGNTNGATITGVTTHNIYGQDPLLGPLADNGGPTLAHALLPGSPAIDHGSSSGLATDQRGQPRPFNFPAYFDADDASDIGAYELQERAQTGPVFTVNATNDVDDGVPGIAHCSLREAIAAANANADTNMIDFAVEVPGVHTGVIGTITLTNGQLTITNSVNINGPGAANLTVSGNNTASVLALTNFGFSPPTVLVSDLTITKGGDPISTTGGGIYNPTAGALTVSNCVITKCLASSGGGITTLGDLTVLNSTISSNVAASSAGGGVSIGGISVTPRVDCVNSTVSGNASSNSWGGGFYVFSGLLNLDSCTVVSNYSYQGAGGVHALSTPGQEVSSRNTIIALNTSTLAALSPDYLGNLDSLDYNLIQNTNGATITNLTAHNIYNQDPKPGPLADLGGPTPTHALRFDSPALDAGHSGGLTTDQRGLPRPIDDPNTPNAAEGDGSDIGAYEADPNLHITALEKVGPNIRVRFNTLFGRTYGLEREDSLNASWSVISSNVTGTGGSFQVLDAGSATLPKRFYRAVMILP